MTLLHTLQRVLLPPLPFWERAGVRVRHLAPRTSTAASAANSNAVPNGKNLTSPVPPTRSTVQSVHPRIKYGAGSEPVEGSSGRSVAKRDLTFQAPPVISGPTCHSERSEESKILDTLAWPRSRNDLQRNGATVPYSAPSIAPHTPSDRKSQPGWPSQHAHVHHVHPEQRYAPRAGPCRVSVTVVQLRESTFDMSLSKADQQTPSPVVGGGWGEGDAPT